MKHHTQVYVDLLAFENNIQTIKKHLPKNTLYCAVLKGDAYGHGLKNLAKVAIHAGANLIAIVDNWEAALIRELDFNCPLLRLRPALEDEIQEAIPWKVQELCGSIESAQLISQIGLSHGEKVPVHLKIDVGMGRMGFSYESVDQLMEILVQEIFPLPGINIVGIMCHFPSADEKDLSITHQQSEKFCQIFTSIKPYLHNRLMIHTENSAATLRLNEHRNMVRVGLAGYGLRVGGAEKFQKKLYPVLSWKSKVVQVRNMKKGSTIGYGMTYQCPADCMIATLPFGYADGFPRALSNNADVLIHGKRCPVVGRVSMNLVTVDVTHLNRVQIGDEVVMIGKQDNEIILLDELADRAGMLNYELACVVGKCNISRVTI